MVDLIGLRQSAGTWSIVAQAKPVIGLDWMKVRAACRDVTGPTMYEDLAAVFNREQLLALATGDEARGWVDAAAPDADLFLVILGENLESLCGD